VIDHVSNAASYILAPPQSQVTGATQESSDVPIPNSGIAQGSFFAVFGLGLASGTNIWPASYPLPTTTGGSSVTITVNGTTTNALIYFAGSFGTTVDNGTINSQINGVMPSSTPAGSGTMVVTLNGQSSQPFPVTVVPSSFGIFTANEGGTGPGAFYNIDGTTGAPTANNIFSSAMPGQIITLFGTGLAPVASPSAEGQAGPPTYDVRTAPLNYTVQVWVGNQQVPQSNIQYAGRSSYTAEDQIDFTVPAGIDGCYNNVAVVAGPTGNLVVSNFPTLSVSASGGPCKDGDGIDMSTLVAPMTANGHVNLAGISLLSNYLILSLGGGITQLPFDNDTLNGEIAQFTQTELEQSLGLTLVPSANSCAVSPFFGLNPVPTDPVLAQLTYLNAGTDLTLTGPNSVPGTNPAMVPMNANGHGYGALVGGSTIANLLSGNSTPPFYLTESDVVNPATYMVSGAGGTQVGAFSGSVSVPGPLTLGSSGFGWNESQGAVSSGVSLSGGLTITWSGGDPNGFVDITGISSSYVGAGTPSSVTPGIIFECMAPTSAGSFTIPPPVLAALPTSGSSTVYPVGYLLVGPAGTTVSITPPSGLDGAYLFYHFIQGETLAWTQ
jgi:uncharacterized protein (TIGR03437 family)